MMPARWSLQRRPNLRVCRPVSLQNETGVVLYSWQFPLCCWNHKSALTRSHTKMRTSKSRAFHACSGAVWQRRQLYTNPIKMETSRMTGVFFFFLLVCFFRQTEDYSKANLTPLAEVLTHTHTEHLEMHCFVMQLKWNKLNSSHHGNSAGHCSASRLCWLVSHLFTC